MYCFMKLLRFATPLLGLCLFLIALPAAGQTDAEIRGLIDRLDTQGPGSLDARRRATETLEGFIRNNRLTPAQFEILRTYPPGPALELLRRKELILSRWTTQFPTVAMAIDRTRFETLPRSIDRDWFFKIDGFFGGANIGDATVVGYYQRYEDARNALAAACQ